MSNSKQAFQSLIDEIQQQSWYKQPIGFGIARVDRGQLHPEKILQATFPVVNWNENFGSAAVFLHALQQSGHQIDMNASELVHEINQDFINECLNCFSPFIAQAHGGAHKNVQLISQLANGIATEQLQLEDFKVVFIFEDEAPTSAESVYLKLYALSLGKAALRSLNLSGAFGQLQNCAWAGNQPIELEWLRANEMTLKLHGDYPEISMVDKFPRFLSHIIPADNTRILETAKVRFGAQLAAGTTVMPGASYINFNAGTLGPVMVEGRISSSAVVGAGSDIGGGASILGVLSGTDGTPISIGENTLLGVNSCAGISVGDGCILDANVAILAGTKISLTDKAIEELSKINPNRKFASLMKGAEFIGVNGVHFRHDSLTGKTIAMRSTREVKLNQELH